MSRVTGVGILLIQVSDIARSVTFWREGLGIPFRDQGADDGCWECRVGETMLLLHPDFGSDLRDARRGAGIAIHLSVDDADAYHAELVKRGIRATHPPEDRPWGREFSVLDPDGYEIDGQKIEVVAGIVERLSWDVGMRDATRGWYTHPQARGVRVEQDPRRLQPERCRHRMAAESVGQAAVSI